MGKPCTRKSELPEVQAAHLYMTKKYEMAANIYQQCIDNVDKTETKQHGPTEKVTYLEQLEYMLCVCLLELKSKKYEDMWQVFLRLFALKNTYRNIFPAVHHALAKTYMKMYNFPLAMEEIKEGFSFLVSGASFDQYCIPQTNITIEETTRQGLLYNLTKIQNECALLNSPDAICHLDSRCKNILPSTLFKTLKPQETNKAIYFKDPNFKGMIVLTCNNNTPCILEYHLTCWEYQKNLCDIKDNRDILNFNCFTKKCTTKGIPNTIVQISVIGENGQILDIKRLDEASTSNIGNDIMNPDVTKDMAKSEIYQTIKMAQVKINKEHFRSKELEEQFLWLKRNYIKTENFDYGDLNYPQKYCDKRANPMYISAKEILRQATNSASTSLQQNVNELTTASDIDVDECNEEKLLLDDFDDSSPDQKRPSCALGFNKYDELPESSEEASPKYFDDFDVSPIKSSSAESKSSRSRSRNSNKTSPFKLFGETMSKMMKNVEKLKPIFKRTSNNEQTGSNGSTPKKQHLLMSEKKKNEESIALEEIITGAEKSLQVKRKITFDDFSTNVENNNDTVCKSPDTIDKPGTSKSVINTELTIEKNESLNKEEILSTANEEVKKKILKSRPPSLSQENLQTYRQHIEDEYFILYADYKVIKAQVEKQTCVINEQTTTIECLNKKIKQFELAANHQFETDDSNLAQKIIGSSLQKFRALISESIREHKQVYTDHYNDKVEKEKKKMKEQNKMNLLEYERKNIELQKNLEIKEKELNHAKSELESMAKEYLDFKTKMLFKRLRDQYEKTHYAISRNIDFYNIAINTIEKIKNMFKVTIAENLSYEKQELRSWRDNITFLCKELQNCEEAYVHGMIQLSKEEYIEENNDIPWINYTIPAFSTVALSLYVENTFTEFYNKLTEKWCQEMSHSSQDETLDKSCVKTRDITNNGDNIEQHSTDDKHDNTSVQQYKYQETKETVTEHEEQQDDNILTSSPQSAKRIWNKFKECKIDTIAKYNRKTDKKVKIGEMDLASDKEVTLSKPDENVTSEEIGNESNEASNKEIIKTDLSNDNDNMKNLSPKEKKCEGVIKTELSDDSDNMKDLSPKEEENKGEIESKLMRK